MTPKPGRSELDEFDLLPVDDTDRAIIALATFTGVMAVVVAVAALVVIL